MKKIILNHESYLSINEIKEYIKEFPKIQKENFDIVIFPSILYLSLFEDFSTEVGSQNFYSESYGDYTGEISLAALKDLNVNYTMVSHKDRISNLIDNKNQVKEKLLKSLNNDFKTILVVGEDKMSSVPFNDMEGYLNFLLKGINKEKLNNLIILYEPKWMDDELQDINIIRKVVVDIKEYFIKSFKTNIEVCYGSGVDKDNINDILSICDGICIDKKSTDLSFIKDVFDNIN